MTRRARNALRAAAATISVAAIAIGVAAATPGAAPLPPPLGVGGNWNPRLDDEFNGNSLNRGLWTPSRFGGGSGVEAGFDPSELECFDPAQVSVGGGMLALSLVRRSERCNGRLRRFSSGVVTTEGHWSYSYGFLQVSARLPGGRSVDDWPAVWAVGADWPRDGEIDLVEGLGGHACWHFHYLAGAPGACSQRRFAGGWHVYGVDWEPGSITWYYDGRRVGHVSTGVTSARMSLIIDLAAGGGDPGPLRVPATLRVRYVRVWQH